MAAVTTTLKQEGTGYRLSCRGPLSSRWLVMLLAYFKQESVPIRTLEWHPNWQQAEAAAFQLQLLFELPAPHPEHHESQSAWLAQLQTELIRLERAVCHSDSADSTSLIAESQSPKTR